jgi:hypothetical protein
MIEALFELPMVYDMATIHGNHGLWHDTFPEGLEKPHGMGCLEDVFPCEMATAMGSTLAFGGGMSM